jgi:hypothetical protein
VHLHHSTPGIVLLTLGAFTSIGAPPHAPYRELAALAIGIGKPSEPDPPPTP